MTLLLRVGDLTRDATSCAVLTDPELMPISWSVCCARAACWRSRSLGEKRLIAIEDAARYRDALGIPLPPGIATALLADGGPKPVLELVRRYARTHGPFTLPRDRPARFGLDTTVRSRVCTADACCSMARIVEGGFRPGGVYREWCDAEVLRLIRRKSLGPVAARSRTN